WGNALGLLIDNDKPIGRIVFGEAMMMRKIAGDYVPKPLDCEYILQHPAIHYVILALLYSILLPQ
ncbi:MAG: hypothetical protein KAH77_07605, partial [Thiomargarita sp.]|nr:hypothetical protein [Thiomargarita sp.]